MIARLVTRAKRIEILTLLRISGALTIIGLVMMVWSLVQPTPLPVMLAMSVGQLFGMFAFALYLVAIVIDQRRDRRAKRASQPDITGDV